MEINNTQHKFFLCNKKYDEYEYMMYLKSATYRV